jgi:hypothetical protein
MPEWTTISKASMAVILCYKEDAAGFAATSLDTNSGPFCFVRISLQR